MAKRPQGNHPLRYPTIYNVPISKEEMGIISTTGLIKGIDDNGFIIYDNENLSGSHVYWSNLKEIRQTEDKRGILVIYKNLSDEIFENKYANWDELMDSIPEDFGEFHSLKLENLPDDDDDFSELTGMDYDEAKDMVSEINQMRAEFMGDNPEESSDYEEIVEEEEIEAEEFVENVIAEQEGQEEESEIEESHTEEESRYEVPEYELSAQKLSDQDLLQKILAEASGSRYSSENLRYQRTEQAPTSNVVFKANASIEQLSSLGFQVKVGGETHDIDFGKFSDAYFSESADALIFEHRNGKTVTFPKSVNNWQEMIQKMPFRFRSFDRKLMRNLASA